jgi:hypothetical protein
MQVGPCLRTKTTRLCCGRGEAPFTSPTAEIRTLAGTNRPLCVHARFTGRGVRGQGGDRGELVMTDWPLVGSILLGLTAWFGFLYLLLYLLSLSATMPP